MADQMVLHAINTGVICINQDTDEQIKQDAVMNFVSSYGLLGFMTALSTTPEFITYEAVYSIAARCSLLPDRTRYFAAGSVRTSITCIKAEEKAGLETTMMTKTNDSEKQQTLKDCYLQNSSCQAGYNLYPTLKAFIFPQTKNG